MTQTTSELNKISHQIRQINPVVRHHIQVPGEGRRLSLADAKIMDPWKRGAWSSQKVEASQRALCFSVLGKRPAGFKTGIEGHSL